MKILRPLMRFSPLLALLSASCQGDPPVPVEKPRINLRFLYGFCNDVEAMHRFYTETLGLKEQRYDKEHWICFNSEGIQLMFFRNDVPLAVPSDFAAQPGGGGGEAPRLSWSIQVPEDLYPETILRIQESGAPTKTPVPVWLQNSYWAFVVLDPMGNTVEVYIEPKVKPASTEWKSPGGKR